MKKLDKKLANHYGYESVQDFIIDMGRWLNGLNDEKYQNAHRFTFERLLTDFTKSLKN